MNKEALEALNNLEDMLIRAIENLSFTDGFKVVGDAGVYSNTIRAALTPQPEPIDGQWQPIETAPKDGRSVRVFDYYQTDFDEKLDGRYKQIGNDGFGEVIARFDKENGWHVSASVRGGKYIKLNNPTHWMPLPKPPADI